MTNGWIDIKNTDMMLIMGGNPAENHPCGFKWAIEAKRQRNAKMIVVDPRFTRTAATADMFLQIRAGADIAFLGGLIKYAIEKNRIAGDYLLNYTTRLSWWTKALHCRRTGGCSRASILRPTPTTGRLGITKAPAIGLWLWVRLRV